MFKTFASRPKVTIGVCVRNSATTLPEALQSLVIQDFPYDSMEIVFVDDGSEDDTLSVIEKNSSNINSRIKIIHTARRGLGHARNLVLSNASGEYVVWLDGDMVISRDFVRQLVNFMEHNPGIGIAKGKQSLEHGGNVLATLEAYSRAIGRMIDYKSESSRNKALGTGGSIYRTDAILKAGGFDERLTGYGEDWDAEIRVRDDGWSLDTVDVRFLDYERNKITWRNLWKRYWLRGYCSHYFVHKNKGLIKHYKMFPAAAFLNGIVQAHRLFELTSEKIVFLLPLEHMFKMIAWNVGFTESHLECYQPE